MPKRLTAKSVKRYKAALRSYDKRRIGLKLATRRSVQMENSLIRPAKVFKILNIPEARV